MSSKQRLVLIIAILTSFIPFSGESMINVLLPVIERELGGGLAVQQWVANGYMLTLGSFILIAGSLFDLFGRLRILRYGLIGFGIASLLCAVAPTGPILVIARLLQGAAGALLLPSSLALITDFIAGKHFSKAIGSRTGWTSIAFVIGPLLGGFFVDSVNWRLAFAANVIPVVVTLWLVQRLPRSALRTRQTEVDIWGAFLCVIAFGSVVFGLIEQARLGWSHPLILASLVVGLLTFGAFIRHELRYPYPMLPLKLFTHRNFTVGNIATLTVYGGLTTWGFVMALFLQQVVGYSALVSGLALVPVTVIMFLGSSRAGVFSQRFGPRWFMTIGSLMAASGVVLLALAMKGSAVYLSDILPGLLVFGLGVTLTATPLTAAVLSAVANTQSGIASAVNNAVVSIAGLLTIAVIGIALTAQFGEVIEKNLARTDLTPQTKQALATVTHHSPQVTVPSGVTADDIPAAKQILRDASVNSFQSGMLLIAVLVALGGTISAVGIRNTTKAVQRD